jgi:uncharacterized membrane protein
MLQCCGRIWGFLLCTDSWFPPMQRKVSCLFTVGFIIPGDNKFNAVMAAVMHAFIAAFVVNSICFKWQKGQKKFAIVIPAAAISLIHLDKWTALIRALDSALEFASSVIEWSNDKSGHRDVRHWRRKGWSEWQPTSTHITPVALQKFITLSKFSLSIHCQWQHCYHPRSLLLQSLASAFAAVD